MIKPESGLFIDDIHICDDRRDENDEKETIRA